MIAAILFDKDGTLIDFQKTWGRWTQGFLDDLAQGDTALIRQMAAALHYDPDRGLFAPDSPVIAGTADEATDLLLPFLPHWTRDELLQHGDIRAQEAPLAEVTPLGPLLRTLSQRGLRLGVATNDTEAAARRHMDRLGATQHFDQIIGFDSGYGGKPAPGMVLGFCQSAGIVPERCVMVGDSLHDLHAGRAAGAITVGVLTGLATPAELSPFADAVLPDISHLPDWLAKTDAGRR